MDDLEREIPLWWFTTVIHNRIEHEQQETFDNGYGYLFTDDDRACRAREIVEQVVDRNGVSQELGNLILAKYYQDYIWDGPDGRE